MIGTFGVVVVVVSGTRVGVSPIFFRLDFGQKFVFVDVVAEDGAVAYVVARWEVFGVL